MRKQCKPDGEPVGRGDYRGGAAVVGAMDVERSRLLEVMLRGLSSEGIKLLSF